MHCHSLDPSLWCWCSPSGRLWGVSVRPPLPSVLGACQGTVTGQFSHHFHTILPLSFALSGLFLSLSSFFFFPFFPHHGICFLMLPGKKLPLPSLSYQIVSIVGRKREEENVSLNKRESDPAWALGPLQRRVKSVSSEVLPFLILKNFCYQTLQRPRDRICQNRH